MRTIVMFMTIALVFITSSCASIDQQKTLGASQNKNEGFRILGINKVRSLEGPLTDMLVPDDVPKARTIRIK